MRILYFSAAITLLCTLYANAADEDELARAYRLQQQGALNAARGLYEALIPGLRSHGDQEHLALALSRLGEIDLSQGKYADATAHASECGHLYRKLRKPVDESHCSTLAGRSSISKGDYSDALTEFQHALEIAHSNQLYSDEIGLLNNIGNVAYYLGKYSDAYRYYQEALAQLPAHSKEDWYPRRRLLTLVNLATLYQRLGQHDQALDLYLHLAPGSGSLHAKEQGQMRANMGALYRRLGDPVKALEEYQVAQRSFATDRDQDGEIGVLKNSGIALALDLGDFDRAAGIFGQALRLATESGNRREIVQANLYLGETLRRRQRLHEARSYLERSLAGAQELGTVEDQWKALYGLGQVAEAEGQTSHALEKYRQAIRVIESIRSGLGAAPMRVGFLADKRDVYDAEISILLEQPNPSVDELFRLIENGKARSFQDQGKRPRAEPSISATAAGLPTDTVLLDFWTDGSKVAVLWIDRSASGIERATSPTTREFDALLAQVINGNDEAWRTAAAAVSIRLLQPLRVLDRPYQNIVIVPDGRMQSLPFDILLTKGVNGPQLLIEKFNISYLPAASETGWSGSRTGNRWQPPWSMMFAGFADPIAGSSSAGSSLFPTGGPILAASAGEVRSIARMLGGRSELHTGPDDLKKYVTDGRLKGIPVVHLATHAVADTDDPERSRVLFSPERPEQSADFLFTREIYNLDLGGVQLVMLAACDTEQGKSIRGEGIQSFSRALLRARAGSVITTLWRVGDQGSAEFAKRFYAHLSAGETAAQSLRSSKLEFYRSNSAARHPKYWSVFVLNGNPSTRIPRAIPWTGFAVPILLMASATFGWRHLRRKHAPAFSTAQQQTARRN